MAILVYILCSLTSTGCALVLMRAYWKNRSGLLLWSSLCFLGLALNNILLVVDSMLGPSYDLSIWRGVFSISAVGIMLYGLVWDTV